MADAVSVTLNLVEKVIVYLPNELNRAETLRDDINRIGAHLGRMQAFLRDSEGREGNQTMRALVDQIRNAAHDTEDVLDDYMIHAPRSYSTAPIFEMGYQVYHTLKNSNPINDLLSRIASILVRMSDINNSPEFREVLHVVHRTQRLEAHQSYLEAKEEDEIRGFDAAQENLTRLLLSEGGGLSNTIFVVGPNGAGKTALVRRVYKSKSVIDQFDCHAWLSSTGIVDQESFLRGLLSQFCEGIDEPSGGDTAAKLANYLVEKRFIVVLDGVRRYEEWVFIKQALAFSTASSSRIIITTQCAEIAKQCSPFSPHVVQMNGLDWNESWKLFCRKAYGNEVGECPAELRQLSELIVTRCEHLPYPISMVGDLLSRRPRDKAEWKRVHENLVVEIHGSCINPMFLPSYTDLSANQQSCLLYFSLFPEDFSIKREKLIRLWLSEGFVNEYQAKDILNELISKNLVHSSSRDLRGRVKSCRVLSLMRGFVCQKSIENKFARVIAQASSSHHRRHEAKLERRLSIQNASSCSQWTQGLQLGSVRSVFMFGLDKSKDPCKIIEGALGMMKRLRVLDLEDAPLMSFPECLVKNILPLRYLSLRNTRVNVIPRGIKNLRYLEFLDLKQTEVSKLPEEICSLENLRDLLVYRCNPNQNESFEKLQGVEIDGVFKVSPFIRKLSLIRAKQSLGFYDTLMQLTQLKKLGLVNLREMNGPLLCRCINHMPDLLTLDLASSTKEENLDLQTLDYGPELLEHLYLKGRLTVQAQWFSSLSSLSRLILRGSRLNSSAPFEVLQKLPNLMELEMNDAFTGDVLIIDTGAFPKLMTLYIERFDSLTTIVAYDGTMPFLQKLTLVSCMRLHELPWGIQGLKCLEKLILYDMPWQFINRLYKSSEERDMVNHIPAIHSFYVSENNTWQVQDFSFRDCNK